MEYDPQDLPCLVEMGRDGTRRQAKSWPFMVVRDLSAQKFTTRWGNRFLDNRDQYSLW